MKKWKCKKCGKKKDVEHHENHEIKEHNEDKAECINCGETVNAPLCCDKKMYIAS